MFFLLALLACGSPEGTAPSAEPTVPHPETEQVAPPSCPEQVAALSQFTSELLYHPERVEEPRAEAWDARLDRVAGLEGEAAPREMVAIYKQLVAGCPAALEPVAALPRIPLERKFAWLDERLPVAVASCGCDVDMDGLRAWLWRLHAELELAARAGEQVAGEQPAGG